MSNATVFKWDSLPKDSPMPRIDRRRIIGDKMMISQVFLARGFDLASHRHENEQFVVLISGRCLFGLGEENTPAHRTIELNPGEVLHLPGNVPHSCKALEDTQILDLFSPISEKTGVDTAPRAH